MAVAQLNGGYSLPASKWFSNVTSIVKYVRNVNNLKTTSKARKILESFYYDNVDYGKGIISTYLLGPVPVNDLQKESTLLTPVEAAIAQEIITIDKFKTAKVSNRDILTNDAYTNGESVSQMLAFIQSIPNYSLDRHMLLDVMIPELMNWVPGQESQKLEIDFISENGVNGADLQAIKTLNVNAFAKEIKKLINNMQIPNSKYTDIATYTDPNDGVTQRNVETSVEKEELVLYINDKYYTDLEADSLAKLYNKDEVSGMIPENIIVLPESLFSGGNENTIGWLVQKNKFSYADFYNIQFAFLDGSNLYNHLIVHKAYGSGTFKYRTGVKITEKTSV